MRRVVCVLIALSTLGFAVQAQDAKKILEAFKRNFAIASLDVKIQILQDAAGSANAADMGPLHQQALDFVADNASLAGTDPRFLQLAAIAAEQIAAVAYSPARFSVWKLFQIDADTQTLVKAATALGVVGSGDKEIVGNLNQYMDNLNAVFSSGKTPELAVVSACVQALGKLGDPSSFPIVFSTLNLGYGDQVSAIARDALLSIKGDLKEMLLDVIRTRPVGEKLQALQMALETDRLSDDQKGQVAEFSLDISLHSSAADSAGKAALREMRFAAARSLGDRKWSKAAALLIENLDMTIGELDRGLADKRSLLDAVAALGAMGTHEASVRLTQYLVLINSYTEKGKGFDEQIVLAVLENLGALGDKVAFDDLMYTQYLNYGTGVKKAARTALDKLKW